MQAWEELAYEREEGHKEGLKEGLKEGERNGIRNLVNTMRKHQLDEKVILEDVMENYNLTPEEAQKAISEVTQ